MIYFLFIFIFFQDLLAAGEAPSMTAMQAYQSLYSGDKYESFGETGSGVGAEIMKISKCAYLCSYTKLKVTLVEGKQKFLDDTTERNLLFTFYQGQGEYGYKFYPMGKSKDGFNMNVSLGVGLSYNYLSLNSSSLTQLKETEQTLSGALVGGIGGEIGFKLGRKSMYLTGEVTYNVETTSLAGQKKFMLPAVGLHAGFGW